MAVLVLSGVTAVEPARAAGAQAEPALPPKTSAQIEKLINEKMSRDTVPSLSVAVAVNNELTWAAAYGLADVENNVPATTRTLYRTASIDKWLTATAAMRLVEQGKLSLEAEAREHCKVFPEKRWPIKLRHLLNHTAGIRHYWGGTMDYLRAHPVELNSATWQRYFSKHPAHELLAQHTQQGMFIRYTDRITPLEQFKDDPLLFEPGTDHFYSSLGYRLLGCVLEGASGEPYTALMKRVVFGPAQMPHTTPDDSWAIVPHRASLYSLGEQRRLRRANFRDVSENLPAGGHLSRPAELVNFAVAFNTGRLLGSDSVQRMIARADVSTETGRPAGEYYGFGIRVMKAFNTPESLRGVTVLAHTGGQSGTTTYLLLVPARGISMAIMMNRDSVDTDDVVWPILEILMEA